MAVSTTKTLRISHPLANAVDASIEDWGYRQFAGAGRGTLRYAVLARSHHTITAAWETWSDARQDAIDQALEILAGSGRPARGSWLETILDRMAGAEKPPRKQDPDLPLRVARELLKIASELNPVWKPPAKI